MSSIDDRDSASDPPGAALGAFLSALGRHGPAQLRSAIGATVVLTILTGLLFPAATFALAQALFPNQAAGSLVSRNGVVVGSRLIGQSFAQPRYFHPRPSAAGDGYDGASSGGTNLGPTNPRLAADVAGLARAYRQSNGLAPGADVPIDAVTRSGSGLDPDISPANAALQAARVARARGLDAAVVRRLVVQHTRGPQFGFLGEARVPVLELNLAVDAATAGANR